MTETSASGTGLNPNTEENVPNDESSTQVPVGDTSKETERESCSETVEPMVDAAKTLEEKVEDIPQPSLILPTRKFDAGDVDVEVEEIVVMVDIGNMMQTQEG